VAPILCRAIEEMQITTLAIVPPVLQILVEGVRQTKINCANLRLVTVGAARANESVVCEFFQVLPDARLALTYGLTEACPRVATQFICADSFDAEYLGASLS